MLTRQSQPSISRSFDCQFHYHIVSSRTTSSIPLGIRRLSSLWRKKERVANKKRKSALSLFYLLNIVKIFVKIRFRVYDISFARKEISQFLLSPGWKHVRLQRNLAETWCLKFQFSKRIWYLLIR